MTDLQDYLDQVLEAVRQWEHTWGPYESHPSMEVDPEAFRSALAAYTDRLRGNYPFFHPRYAGQMLKPPHPAAMVGYVAAMLINPNNHALDGGPPTGQMEKEVVAQLAAMFRFPEATLGHLTGGGTIANLEALWVAREIHPDKGIVFSADAHYTHSRMSHVLRLSADVIPADAQGHMDLDELEQVLRSGRIGTVVATAGTTGLGAVDPIADIVALAHRYGCRVHVDAAYGGFFTILAWAESDLLSSYVKRHLQAVSECDSVVVDPHKHGLQPYGCGCILFRDPSVGVFYKHDSPYTYFTSDELHLGEISLECSRAGAAAGALWLTLQLMPLEAGHGLGPILSACLRAARQWAELLTDGEKLRLYMLPELDILTYYPLPDVISAGTLDAASSRLFELAMNDPQDPIFLSLLREESDRLAAHINGFIADQPYARVLRSVLMKPEHAYVTTRLHERLSALAQNV